MSDDPIPDEAVTVAAEAIEDEAMRALGRDLGTLHRDDIVRAGLAAALPFLRASIAREIMSVRSDRNEMRPYSHGFADGVAAAAYTIRARS